MKVMVHGKTITIPEAGKYTGKALCFAIMSDGTRIPLHTREQLMVVRRLAVRYETAKGNPCVENKISNLLKREFGVYV